jgi:hypothetical protein
VVEPSIADKALWLYEVCLNNHNCLCQCHMPACSISTG